MLHVFHPSGSTGAARPYTPRVLTFRRVEVVGSSRAVHVVRAVVVVCMLVLHVFQPSASTGAAFAVDTVPTALPDGDCIVCVWTV